MPTIKLLPSTYYLSNSSYLSVSNASNMYTDTDSTTYATVTNSRSSTTSYYIYLRGFNFDDVPESAIVESFSIRFKARESGVSTSSSYRPYLCHGTTTITGTVSAVTTTATTQTFSGVTDDWETIKGYGDSFGIRFNCRRSNRNTTSYMYIYGAEIEVTYSLPDPRTITTTLTGNGTISPSGQSTAYDGEEFELTITPNNISDEVTVKNNGTDVSEDLVAHHSGGTSSNEAKTATGFTTELSSSNANFYTGSNSTGNYFNYAVGHTAESPGSTSSSYNTYVKDGGNNTATGWAWFTFDFSDLPEDAEITNVSVSCYGACENTAHDATHKADMTLYSGIDPKSTEHHFTSTSNSTITISSSEDWTREELLDARLKFEVAYYGGRLFGITWNVSYKHGGSLHHYTYTYTVNGNTTISVAIGSASTTTIYIKKSNTWVAYTKAYKKINGAWVEQSDLTSVFDSLQNYVKGN